MCLIVDPSVLGRVLPAPPGNPHSEFEPVHTALLRKTARAIYGGKKLTQEYRNALGPRLAQYDRAGIFQQWPHPEVDAEQVRLEAQRRCVSNDVHIIALARVSGVRLLCSDDNGLIHDFKNREILDQPRNVFRKRSHKHLIHRHCRH
ncbi:MAG: hypothetical protein HYS13_17970 [Planctomycetia bacterium]|nr:hypothetical protein [Planctomycetia bacterium]